MSTPEPTPTGRPRSTPRASRAPRQPRVGLAAGYLLRPWAGADATDLVAGFRDPLVRHYASGLVDDRATALAAVHDWAGQWQDGDGAAWAICGPSGQALGSVRFGLLDPGLGAGAVGYWLLPEARGRGLATAALRAGTLTVFERLHWHRIELHHAVENERSCAVARRSGYLAEGLLRSAMCYPVDGRRSDEHLHARLRADPGPV